MLIAMLMLFDDDVDAGVPAHVQDEVDEAADY